MVIERKITNKRRCKFRGKKQRYAVWRAEYNRRWECCHEVMVRRICEDNNLNLEDHMSQEKRNTWGHTYNDLKAKGYYMLTASIKQMIGDTGMLNDDWRPPELRD